MLVIRISLAYSLGCSISFHREVKELACFTTTCQLSACPLFRRWGPHFSHVVWSTWHAQLPVVHALQCNLVVVGLAWLQTIVYLSWFLCLYHIRSILTWSWFDNIKPQAPTKISANMPGDLEEESPQFYHDIIAGVTEKICRLIQTYLEASCRPTCIDT